MTGEYNPRNAPSHADVSGFGSDKAAGQDSFMKNPIPLSNGGLGSGSDKYRDFLTLARENFIVGRNYFDISVRKRMEDNLAHAYSRHASGSKFWSPDYDKRSKIFRPKTRAMMRKLEAAAAIAFFSTRDILDCRAVDDDDINNVIAAEVHKELLNYRLRTTIPWYKLCLGAFHDAMTAGVVISAQEWLYKEATMTSDKVDEDGNPTGESIDQPLVLKDTSNIRLVPVENILFHPSSEWVDPVNSSPYIIEMTPWFAPEFADRIKNGKQFGSQVPYLREWTEQDLMAGMSEINNSAMSVRMAREHSRLDRYSQVQQGQRFRPIWIHRNIVRLDGLDYVYETLGINMLLSEPVPIEDVFGRRRRPYVMGQMAIEPHRLYAAGPVEMTKGLQEGINDVTNQRRDNVALVLNNRFLVKRGQMVDSRSLVRNVPGSVTMTSDPTGDVKQLETKDVTSSSYQEQDRFNMEVDELAGQFSQMSVGAMKVGQDTPVGTTEMLGNNADMVAELALQTFCKTWVEPVLTQLIELERAFETDSQILSFVSNRVQKTQDWMDAFRKLEEPVNVVVSVGFGSTDPLKRLQKFQMGIQAITMISPQLVQEMDQREAVHEIFGALGFKDGTRFFPALAQEQDDPKTAALKKQIEDLQGQLQQAEAGIPVAQIKAEASVKIAEIKSQATQNIAIARMSAERWKANLQGQLKQIDQRIADEGVMVKKAGLLLQREALSHSIMEADRAFELQVATSVATPEVMRPEIAVPPSEATLAQTLQHPASEELATSMEEAKPGKPMNLPGPDEAGAIERGRTGMIPGQRG